MLATTQLSVLYNESHRHYHNLQHIHLCLAEMEQLKDPRLSSQDVINIEQAIWWHDAVYNPYSNRNEDSSAALYEIFDTRMWIEQTVVNAILATKHHVTTQSNLDAVTKYVLDIDLSGLGSPWHVYARNSLNIRKEYYNTTTLDFARGRLDFLKKLNERDTFYYTEHFYDKYHAQSKENVENEIEMIENALSNSVMIQNLYIDRLKSEQLKID